MKYFVCLDIEGATPFQVGGECSTPDCKGIVHMMDMLAWRFKCSRGCSSSMPERIAMIDVNVEYMRRPQEDDEDAGQSG
jgi:hypothetical protein